MATWEDALRARSLGLNKLYKLPTRVSSTPTTAPVITPQMTAQDFARQQASAYIQAQIDAINAQKQAYLDQLRQQSDLEMQRGAELAKALQGLNIPGVIQSIYGNASHDIGGLAQAFSGSLRDTATADAARETRMVSGTGQEGAVPNNGAALGDVLYGAQGYIPARNASETGAAFASQAALEPGFAQRIGQVKAGDVYSSGLEGLKQFTDSILQAEASRPQVEQDVLKQLEPQLGHYQLADGREQFYDERTGEPVGPPQGMKKTSATGKNTIRSLANGQLQAFDAQGRPVGKPYGPVKPEGGSSKPTLKPINQGNKVSLVDPYTGKVVKSFTKASLAKSGSKGAAPKQYTYKGTRYTFDKNGNVINQVPLKGSETAKTGGFTAGQLAKMKGTAYETAKQAKLGYTDNKGNVVLEPWDGQPGPNKKGPREVLQDLVGHGIPFRVAVKEIAKFFPVAKKWYNPKAEAAAKTTKPENAAVVERALDAGPRSGIKYVFGGNGENGGYDCSGYTQDMVRQATGVDLPHNAYQQFHDPRGVAVSKGQLQPGDVVFFRSSPNSGSSSPPYHCGYYIGNGKYVEYYSSGKPARVSSLSSRSDFMGARRFGGVRS